MNSLSPKRDIKCVFFIQSNANYDHEMEQF